MSKANEPAFPIPLRDSENWDIKKYGFPNGITKRGYFAGLAMSGMLGIGGPHGHIDGQGDEADTAVLAVKYADALMAELEKSP